MKDCIENIVIKWGFERNVDQDGTTRFVRNYRGFSFMITIKPDYIEIYARTKDDDGNPCSYLRTEFKRDFINHDTWIENSDYNYWKIKDVIKGSIKEFMKKFLEYDLFHEIDRWF